MVHLRLRGRAAAGVAGLALLAVGAAPPGALAASRPAVTTGAAASVTQSTATLTWTVTPNGAPTTYFFQYGVTSVYGTSTAATTVSAKQTVAVPIAGLAPFTVYHYRLVAQNSHGLTKGQDRTFKTKRQPLGVSLIGTPNPVPFGKPTTLQGILSGTGNAGRTVVLQSNPFPYTQGFVNASNPQVTNAQGQFFFPLLSLPINTQFRVLMTDRPDIVSPIVTVFSAVRLTTHISRHGSIARFHGSVTPAANGDVFIQRFSKGHWRTTAKTVLRPHGTSSSFSKHVRIRHSGSYRVAVTVTDGQHASVVGHRHRLHRR
jgi:Fibronectin type III domain